MSKIIRRTITITLTESYIFTWDGMNGTAANEDDAASNRSSDQPLPVEIEDEVTQKEPESIRCPTGDVRRTARTLSQTRSRRRKNSSPLPKMDS